MENKPCNGLAMLQTIEDKHKTVQKCILDNIFKG